MPGILKVGMTERTPEIRLREANASDTWRPPTPYKIEFAKKVFNASCKEKTLHTLLEQYTDRINLRREFFRVSTEEVRKFFDLMDGELWTVTHEEVKVEVEEEEEEEDDSSSEFSPDSTPRIKQTGGCRDIAKCFTDGQRIRHTIGINKTWIGTYNSSKSEIEHDGKYYKTMCGFANSHYKSDGQQYGHRDGWGKCECEVDGRWISTYSLPALK
jgi:hypothetical protein